MKASAVMNNILIIIVLFMFLISTFQKPLTIYLESDGSLVGTTKRWWGLCEEGFEIKEIRGEWHSKKIYKKNFWIDKPVNGNWNQILIND